MDAFQGDLTDLPFLKAAEMSHVACVQCVCVCVCAYVSVCVCVCVCVCVRTCVSVCDNGKNNARKMVDCCSSSIHVTDTSSNEAVFEDAKPMYDNAPAHSGFGERTDFLGDQRVKAKRRNKLTTADITRSTFPPAKTFPPTSAGSSVP